MPFDNQLLPTTVSPLGGSEVIKLDGSVYTGIDATVVGSPRPDGSANYGSGPKVIDAWLDDQPGQIKDNFYRWLNRAKVLSGTGLAITVQPYRCLISTGALVTRSIQPLTLPASAVRFVTISETGDLGSSATLPATAVVLALVTTDATIVTEVIDLREQVTAHLRNLEENGGFNIGDVKETAAATPPTGYVRLDNSILYTAAAYPLAFAVISTQYSLPGDGANTFRVPGGGRVAISSSTDYPAGSSGGSAFVSLTANQNGTHTHPTINPAHTHQTTGGVHSHSINEPEHNHAALGQDFSGDGRTDSLLANDAAFSGEDRGNFGYTFGSRNPGSPLIQKARTNLTVIPSPANVGIVPQPTAVSVLSSGDGQAHPNMQPYYSVNKYIRLA